MLNFITSELFHYSVYEKVNINTHNIKIIIMYISF